LTQLLITITPMDDTHRTQAQHSSGIDGIFSTKQDIHPQTTHEPNTTNRETHTAPQSNKLPSTSQPSNTMNDTYLNVGEDKVKEKGPLTVLPKVNTLPQAEQKALLVLQENQILRPSTERFTSSVAVATMESTRTRPRRPLFLRSRSMMDRNASANPGASLYKPRH